VSRPPFTPAPRRRYARCGAIGLAAVVVLIPGCARPHASSAVRVAHVIDGDTITLADGRTIRYLGIDTPEVRRREGARWVRDPEPFAEEATAANRRLVGGRIVRLEHDTQRRDRYGRTLAYVYVATPAGELMVNAELLRLGLARLLLIPPNVRHADTLRRQADAARQAQRGLWHAAGRPREGRSDGRGGAGASPPLDEAFQKFPVGRGTAQVRQVRVLLQVAKIGIPQIDRPLEGLQRGVQAAEEGVAARQVVPGQRVIGPQPGDVEVDREALLVEPAARVGLGQGKEHVDEVGMRRQQPFVKANFKIQHVVKFRPSRHCSAPILTAS